jgi:hypothetical protein
MDRKGGEGDASSYFAIFNPSGKPAGDNFELFNRPSGRASTGAAAEHRRVGHILDHMDHGPPPGPIVIDNQSGGSVQVTVSRHMASQ